MTDAVLGFVGLAPTAAPGHRPRPSVRTRPQPVVGRGEPPVGTDRAERRRTGVRRRHRLLRRGHRCDPGGLSDVRARRRRRQGRLLPDQGADRGRPRGRPDGEGPRPRATRSPTRSAPSSSPQDGCEGKYLDEAGANRADIVAAVTGDDEDNLVICQMAKHHFDVPRTIARVNNPKNEALFRHLGVDEIISPTRMVLGSIEQDIPVHELLHLAALGSASSRSSRRTSSAGSPAIGKARSDLPCPRAARCSASSATASPTPLRTDTVLARGRQGDRDRPARLRGAAPRAAHRGTRGGLIFGAVREARPSRIPKALLADLAGAGIGVARRRFRSADCALGRRAFRGWPRLRSRGPTRGLATGGDRAASRPRRRGSAAAVPPAPPPSPHATGSRRTRAVPRPTVIMRLMRAQRPFRRGVRQSKRASQSRDAYVAGLGAGRSWCWGAPSAAGDSSFFTAQTLDDVIVMVLASRVSAVSPPDPPPPTRRAVLTDLPQRIVR